MTGGGREGKGWGGCGGWGEEKGKKDQIRKEDTHMHVHHTYTVADTNHFCLTATKILFTPNTVLTDGAANLVGILVKVGPRHQLLEQPQLHL